MATGLFGKAYKENVPVNVRMVIEHFLGATSPITEKDFTTEELNALRKAIENTQKFNVEREETTLSNINKTKKEYEQNPEYSSNIDKKTGKVTEVFIPYETWLETQKKALESFNKTRDKTSFGYGDYDIKSGDMAAPVGQNWLDAAYQSYTDPAFRMASTIGSANYFNKKEETPYIQDAYKFSSDHPAVYGDVSKMSNLDVIRKFGSTPGALFEILASRLAPQSRPVKISLPLQEQNTLTYKDPFASTIK